MAKHNHTKKRVNLDTPVAPETKATAPVETKAAAPIIKKTSSISGGEGWSVKATMNKKGGEIRYYGVKKGARQVCGVARDSVLVLHGPHEEETLTALDAVVPTENITVCSEGTRYRGVNLNKLAEVLKFTPPADLPSFAPRRAAVKKAKDVPAAKEAAPAKEAAEPKNNTAVKKAFAMLDSGKK